MLNEHNTVFAQSGPLYATTVSLQTTRVLDANGISIASAVFAGLTISDRSIDRPIDHTTRSVTIGGAASAQSRSQILLLSTATTSIYWSSRLDKSDQLQQSAAVFICKTKRVAVYVETHYNIASKRAFPIPTGVPDR